MAITLGYIDEKLPDWIKELGSKKHFKYGVGYKGWDWFAGDGGRKIKYMLDFYFPNGFKRSCDIIVPNNLFIYQYSKLDEEANIPALKLDEEDVIKLRLLYLIYKAYRWIENTPAFDPKKSTKYLNTQIAISVDDQGNVEEKYFDR